ncbi:ATP-binding protein [Candidatus Riflebacteria bacterium]
MKKSPNSSNFGKNLEQEKNIFVDENRLFFNLSNLDITDCALFYFDENKCFFKPLNQKATGLLKNWNDKQLEVLLKKNRKRKVFSFCPGSKGSIYKFYRLSIYPLPLEKDETNPCESAENDCCIFVCTKDIGSDELLRIQNFFVKYVLNKIYLLTELFNSYLLTTRQNQKKYSEKGKKQFSTEFMNDIFSGFSSIGELIFSGFRIFPELKNQPEKGKIFAKKSSQNKFFASIKERLLTISRIKNQDFSFKYNRKHKEKSDLKLSFEVQCLIEELLYTFIHASSNSATFSCEVITKADEIKLYVISNRMSIEGAYLQKLVNYKIETAPSRPGLARNLFILFQLFQELGIKITLNRSSTLGLQLSALINLNHESSLENGFNDCLHKIRESIEQQGKSRKRKMEPEPESGFSSVKATRLQKSFLPSRFPKFPGCYARAKLLSSGRCGGDFFNFWEVSENCLLIFLGNIGSQNIYSSLLIAIINSLIAEMVVMDFKAIQILQELDHKIKDFLNPLDEDRISANVMLYDSEKRKLSLAMAGKSRVHFRLKKEGRMERSNGVIGKTSDYLGQKQAPDFFTGEIQVSEGDLFVASSKGVIELLELLNKKRKKIRKLKKVNYTDFDIPDVSGHPTEHLVSTLLQKLKTDATEYGIEPKTISAEDLAFATLQITDPYTFSYEIPSRLEFIHEVTSIVLRYADRYGLDSQSIYHLKLAVHEAVVNAIEHGNKFDLQKVVNVDFHLTPKKFVIRIRDQGNGFLQNQVANPVEPENIWREGGRGIFLIKQLMDEYFFNSTGNEITLVKFLDSSLESKGGVKTF